MAISYKKLWHKLIDMDMNKTNLQKSANLSWASISKLNNGENIVTDIFLRICTTLHCYIFEIIEVIHKTEDTEVDIISKQGQKI